MKDLYIPHIQRRCAPFLITKNPEWDRFDLSNFLELVMQVGYVKTADAHRIAISQAVNDMCAEDPAIAEIFVEDSFTHLGFSFASGLCEMHNLNLTARFMADNLAVLQANMDEHDLEKTQMPQKIYSSNIFCNRAFEGIKSHVINPLMLKMLLGASGETHERNIRQYFEARPINVTHKQLLSLVKGMDERITDCIGVSLDDPYWPIFMAGLDDLEDARMIDREKVLKSFKDFPWYAGDASPLITAIYDDELAAKLLPGLVMSDTTSDSRIAIDESHRLKVRAVLKIINCHKDGLGQAIDVVRQAITGATRPETDPKNTTCHYNHLGHALLRIACESSERAEQVLCDINTSIENKGIARVKRHILAQILLKGEGDRPALYNELVGISPRVDSLLGDLICHFVCHEKMKGLVDPDSAQHLLDEGVLGLKHVKHLVKFVNGSKLIAGLRLPSGMLKDLPARFRDDVLGADLGL